MGKKGSFFNAYNNLFYCKYLGINKNGVGFTFFGDFSVNGMPCWQERLKLGELWLVPHAFLPKGITGFGHLQEKPGLPPTLI